MAATTSAQAIIGQLEIEPRNLNSGSLLNAIPWAKFNGVPWWFVSLALHTLVIALAGLISMSIEVPQADVVVTVTELMPRPNVVQPIEERPQAADVLASKDVAPTDAASAERSNIMVPPELLARAELGDHFETINPDRPDTGGAFGHADAQMFHSTAGNSDAPGGGGSGGAGLEDMIGVGGGGSRGSGGGWGGGNGGGIGTQSGSGRGSFGQRGSGGRKLMVRKHGGSKATEGAVERALRWLAYHQEPDGRWDTSKHGSKNRCDTAMTGLALLAFLGAGHTEKIGEYKDNVQRAVKWLKSVQDDKGKVISSADFTTYSAWRSYPIAIGTMALAEAAGMANVKETRDAAQRAIDYCTEIHQCGGGSERLGFRYDPRQAGDISVTGWFVMAMKSAKVAGLKVNTLAFDGVNRFLDSVQYKVPNSDTGYGPVIKYQYQPDKTKFNDAISCNARTCAIGNLCRQFMGWKKEELQASVEAFISQKDIALSGLPGKRGVDLYYWYYGTLCVFQQGGEVWKKWNEAMKPALTETQCNDGDNAGSWNPVGQFSSDWGRVGQTALSCLCLEVYYRYVQLNQD